MRKWLRRPTYATALIGLLRWWAYSRQPDRLPFDPATYDGQRIEVSGAVTNVDLRTSHGGRPYYTLALSTGSGRVTVFSFGDPPCPEGSRVTVRGWFHQVKRVSGYTFYNQLDADGVSWQ